MTKRQTERRWSNNNNNLMIQRPLMISSQIKKHYFRSKTIYRCTDFY